MFGKTKLYKKNELHAEIKCKQGMGTEADNILANGFIRALHMFVKEVLAFFFSTSQLLIVIKLGQAR